MTNPLHVFLVEDNPGDIELVYEALRENEVEYTMTIARDGAQAKRYIESIGTIDAHCPDVLILDLNLPKADGHELLALLRSHPLCTETPVIVVTSSDSRKDRDRAAALGAARYFRKPTDLSEYMQLGALVREVVEEYRH